MPITTVESEAAHVGRLRRLAAQTGSKGMGCTVRGEELRGMLAAYDRVCDERDAALKALEARRSGGKGKPDSGPVRSFSDDDVRAAFAAANEVYTKRAELWGEPLAVVLAVWCKDQGTAMPDAWVQMTAGV